ncbi:MAG: permease-like cell division protein FtsX [Bacteroidaceae bacterium]|nr:permease-like cell division protein FtsX [Bacteroidaceae bacterium]
MSNRKFSIQTLSVYMSTTLVLILLGTMGLLMATASSLSTSVRKNIAVSVVMDNSVDNKEAEKYLQSLRKRKYVESGKYISKEQVLEEERAALGADPVEFLGYNPYEASIELSMKAEYANNDSLARIEKLLLADKGVNKVVYQKELIGAINSNINKISTALSVLLVLLTVISWSLIGNMVRMSIYSQRFLLHTMKLVGATWGFIRRPFLLRNLKTGLVSGVLANAFLGTALYMLAQKEPAITALLSPASIAAVASGVMLFGITITVLCAYISVNRFLSMRGNDLYFI